MGTSFINAASLWSANGDTVIEKRYSRIMKFASEDESSSVVAPEEVSYTSVIMADKLLGLAHNVVWK